MEVLVALAIVAGFVLVTASAYGARPGQAHSAALALEAALTDARSLAMTAADITDPNYATGATVGVAPDPTRPSGSIITVYRSRPIPNRNGSMPAFPLVPEHGLPPLRVDATFKLVGSTAGAPFAILLSSSGYASVKPNYTAGPDEPILPDDPGCAEGRETITVSDGSRAETHPFTCRDSVYDLAATS